MAAFRSSRLLTGASAASAVFEVPVGAVAGDTLMIFLKVEDHPITVVLPTGGQTWKAPAGQRAQTTEKWTSAVFMLTNWNGTDTKYTVAWGGATDGRIGAIVAFKECDKTEALNAVSGATIKEVTPASKSAVVDPVTATVANCLGVSVVMNNEGLKITNAAAWTEDVDQTDSPQVCHKTELLVKGEATGVTHTSGSNAIFHTLGLALQPSQPPLLPLATAAGSSTTSLGLQTRTLLPLAEAAGASAPTLSLKVATLLPLAAAAGGSSTSLSLKAATLLPLQSASGVSSTSLSLNAPTRLPMASAAGASSTSLALTVKTKAVLPLASAIGTSTATLGVSARTLLPLAAAAGGSSTSAVVGIHLDAGLYIRQSGSWMRL